MKHGHAQLWGLAILMAYLWMWWMMDSRAYDKDLEEKANKDRFESQQRYEKLRNK